MARKPTAITRPAPALAAAGSDEAVTTDQTADNQIVAVLNDSVAGAFAGFEKPQTEVKSTMDKAVKSAEEFVSFSQGNFEAMMKAGQIWAAGVQDLSKQVAASAQASFDETMAAFKAMSGVKSPKDALDMQASLIRTNLEKAVAETGKITDASMKLAEQAFAPITAQMTAAAEKFAKVA